MFNPENTTIREYQLLGQVWTRLVAEGIVSRTIDYDEFLDITFAKGEYKNASVDEIIKEMAEFERAEKAKKEKG